MSIETQAEFWLRNVCEFPEEEILLLKDCADLTAGLREFGEFLKRIYSDYRAFETSEVESVRTKIGIMSDDLENYHNLTDTVSCLYHIAMTGLLDGEGDLRCLRVDKGVLKKAYKKPAAYALSMLERYGFYYKYTKNGKETGSYKACDTLYVYYDNDITMIDAMKSIATQLPAAMNVKEDYSLNGTPFLLADYNSTILEKSSKRKDIDPIKKEIVNTLGAKGELWAQLVKRLKNEFGLDSDVSMNTYVFPNWTVKFMLKKKTIVAFSIRADSLGVRLPLSYESAKKLILKRDKLPQSISESIDRFGCCCCGKCTDKNNIEMLNGIALCKSKFTNFMTEDSRCIRIYITGKDESDAIAEIISDRISSI